MRSYFKILITALLVSLPAWGATTTDGDLYYSVEDTFKESLIETRLIGGYDFSNPFLNVYSAGAGIYWLADPSLSFGVEGTGYGSQNRGAADWLQGELARDGYLLLSKRPEYSAVGVIRLTPMSGMLNLFSYRLIKVDVNLLARGGMIKYRDNNHAPLFGTGVETHFGITPAFGVVAAVLWDVENLPSQGWQVRNGFRIGPTLRF